MGLFDRAKNAFGGAGAAADSGAGAAGDWAAQAQAAQELAAQRLRDAGHTDGSQVTMANAGDVGAAMSADRDVLTAYGNELNRIIAIGHTGTSVITSSVDTGERIAGNPWFQLAVEVSLPGQAPYTVNKREMVPPMFLANYAVGAVHEVKVDPADPLNIAFSN